MVIIKYLTCLLVFYFFAGCSAETDTSAGPSESGFVHTVYFYLHDSLAQEDKNRFKLVLDTLATIPGIQEVYYGPPAMTPRRVVDNDYDYAWITVFADSAAHDAYQNHPLHKTFKQRYTPMIADVKIYDNLVR